MPIKKTQNEALLKASLDGNIEQVKLLLGLEGIDVNIKNDFRYTPLHYAACYDYKEIAELLLQEDVDVNAKDISGSTPLHHASGRNNEEIVLMLLQKGADVNAKDDNRRKPLFYASLKGYKEVEAILKTGTGINEVEKLKKENAELKARLREIEKLSK